jgi:hypothetical protein
VTPAVASAATGGTATLAKPFAWSGGPGQGLVLPLLLSQVDRDPVSDETISCTEIYVCDDTLVKVDAADAGNDLTFTLDGHAGDTPSTPIIGADLDLYVFKSDASGAVGDELGRSETEGAAESVALPAAAAGYYLVRVRYYHAINATYDAKAALSLPLPPEEEEE